MVEKIREVKGRINDGEGGRKGVCGKGNIGRQDDKNKGEEGERRGEHERGEIREG